MTWSFGSRSGDAMLFSGVGSSSGSLLATATDCWQLATNKFPIMFQEWLLKSFLHHDFC